MTAMPDTTHDPAALNRRLAELLGFRVELESESVYRLRYPDGWPSPMIIHLGTDPEECWRANTPDFYHDANAALRALEAVRNDRRWRAAYVNTFIEGCEWFDPAYRQWRVRMVTSAGVVIVPDHDLDGRVMGDRCSADTIPAAIILACITALERLKEEAV